MMYCVVRNVHRNTRTYVFKCSGVDNVGYYFKSTHDYVALPNLLASLTISFGLIEFLDDWNKIKTAIIFIIELCMILLKKKY
jgi:hypothetical protein